MDLKKYKEEELKNHIIELLAKNGIREMYCLSALDIADQFLTYTPLARQIILDWYTGLTPTKASMNWIEKTGFERQYFYIGGTDALVAMALLGYCVSSQRCANVSSKSMCSLNGYGHKHGATPNFFQRYGLKSKDINISWSEWH